MTRGFRRLNVCAAVAVIAAMLCAAATQTRAAETRAYVIGIHLKSTGGMASSQEFDTANSLLSLVEKEYGIKWEMKKYSSYEELARDFIEDRLDGAAAPVDNIVEIMDARGDVIPFVTYTVAGQNRAAYCIWQSGEKEAKNVSDLAGRTVISEYFNRMSLVKLREYLYGNGVDRPLWKFFGTFTRVSGNNSAFMAVAMGNADVYFEVDDYKYLLKFLNPALVKKLGYESCSGRVYARPALVWNGKRVSAGEIEKFRKAASDAIKNMDRLSGKYPEMRFFSEYAKMVGMKLKMADADEFKTELELYGKAKENGWLDEAGYIVKMMESAKPGEAVKIKLTYRMCKTNCAGASDEMKCLDDCMR